MVEEVSRAYNYERMSFGPEYLLPKPIDPRILIRESAAVARQAAAEGVARKPLDEAAYQESLAIRLGPGRETLRRLMVKARQEPLRIVFSEDRATRSSAPPRSWSKRASRSRCCSATRAWCATASPASASIRRG